MRNHNKWADLHIHSSFSDGEWSPKQVVEAAKKLGLSAIAIADHDTVDAVAELINDNSTAGIEIIPAVEINTDLDEREVHILGYLIDVSSPILLKALKKQREARIKRNEEIVKKLNRIGLRLTIEEVIAVAGGNSVGRPHIAQVLVNKGYVMSKEEAFFKWLKRGSPGYVPRCSMSWREAIEVINKAGGIAVLAHPGKSFVDPLIPHMIKAGLQGIEVWHPSHSPEDSQHYLKIVKDFSLLATGGSDAHSPKDIPLIEQFKIDYERVSLLKSWWRKRLST